VGGGSEDYRYGAVYLKKLADSSGGRLHNADTLSDLDRAFARIAEELRHQYLLSYYPTNSAQDGSYRTIKVRVDQPDLIVRARQGYRAKGGPQSEERKGKRPTLKTRKQKN
jgi:Ca-activated chloride channel family protein